MNKRVSDFALKSLAAKDSDAVVTMNHRSVVLAEDILLDNEEVYYVGVKDTNVIPSFYLENLKENGFIIHTRDKMSDRGRAIDYELINPITGRFMTGSSSGTAINVFRDINDVGIGTDGGGSVLAPAISLNLYGFISPYICNQELALYSKKSTDNIVFQPAIGFISKEMKIMENIINQSIEMKETIDLNLVVAQPNNDYQKQTYDTVIHELQPHTNIELSYDSSSREALMEDLKLIDFDKEILVTFEGPVDLFEYGDSLQGHYSELYKKTQMQAHKYYLTVVNMMGLSALIIPSENHAVGSLLICKSDPKHIKTMLEIAKKISFKRSELEERYFSVLNI